MCDSRYCRLDTARNSYRIPCSQVDGSQFLAPLPTNQFDIIIDVLLNTVGHEILIRRYQIYSKFLESRQDAHYPTKN